MLPRDKTVMLSEMTFSDRSSRNSTGLMLVYLAI